MRLRHLLSFVVSRAIPGLINFGAVALYTHMVSPAEYGWYALVVAVVGFAASLLFQGLNVGLLRFLSEADDRERAVVQAGVRTCFFLIAMAAVSVALVAAAVFPAKASLLIGGAILLIVQSWFELNCQVLVAEGNPRRYGVLLASRSVAGVICAVLLARFGGVGLLVGTIVGFRFASVLFGADWGAARRLVRSPRVRARIRAVLAYGLPITASYALDVVINASDRIFLSVFHGTGSTGPYAAGYDLSQQSIGMLMMVVNLAAFPRAVQARASGDADHLAAQLRLHFGVLFFIAAPATVGLTVLSPAISGTLLGAGFVSEATTIMPLIALAAFLAGLRAFYFDLSFQLTKNTRQQIRVMLPAALVNVVLNVVLIPPLGAMGAAIATLVSYVLSLILSLLFGRRSLHMPVPRDLAIRVAIGAAFMGAVLWPFRNATGALPLATLVGAGMVLFAGSALLLGVFRSLRGASAAAAQGIVEAVSHA
jgi:O-antigen/teichoic acid export membrane protein